jgi:hypothetical protein
MPGTPLDIRQANTIEPGSQDVDSIRALLGNDDYIPTILQCRLFLAFIDDSEERSPQVILRDDLGSGTNLWYMWCKGTPGFNKWWNTCLESVYSGFRLNEVWRAMIRRAKQNSPQDAKMVLERFDTQYKPTTAQERIYSVAPLPDQDQAALAESSRKREVKRIESTVKEVEE